MTIDLIYLAHGRPEFTAASFETLLTNTNWSLVRRLIIYTDGDRAFECTPALASAQSTFGLDVRVDLAKYGGPVAIMNAYLDGEVRAAAESDAFAKIDNDVIVPPGWLDQAVAVLRNHCELDLLGIEPPASRTPAPWAGGKYVPKPECGCRLAYAECDSIGGIGLMRTRAFLDRPAMKPFAIVGGFTNWQQEQKDVVKGWIVPPLRLFLLDRLPIEPWASLSRRYLAQGYQRPWTMYSASAASLWEWWL